MHNRLFCCRIFVAGFSLLDLMCGLREVQNGEVLFDGKPIFENVEAKEKIAYVRDEQNYVDHYKAVNLIKIYKACYPDFDKEKINKLNEIFQLDLGKTIATYSKGQRMCMAFMLAMAQNADFILLDEPFGGVDAGKQKVMKEYLISEMENREVGIVFSTHQLEDLNRLCDKVAFVKKGKVEKLGTVDEVIENTVDKYEAVLSEEQVKQLKEEKRILLKPNLGRQHTIYLLKDTQDDTTELKDLLSRVGVVNPAKQIATLEECYYLYNENMKNILEQN